MDYRFYVVENLFLPGRTPCPTIPTPVTEGWGHLRLDSMNKEPLLECHRCLTTNPVESSDEGLYSRHYFLSQYSSVLLKDQGTDTVVLVSRIRNHTNKLWV